MTPYNQGSENDPSVSADRIDDDDISLRPLFQVLWAYRRVMVLLGCVIGTVFVLWATLTYVRQPVERQASVEFQLLFEGASDNRYPNGLTFSHAEIVGDTILREVYQGNDLERYLSFDDFKRRAVVLGTNSEVELLSLEYQARLAAEGITQVERVALEQEFGDRRGALQSAHYRLSFITPGRVVPIPDELMRKVLSDVLAEWANQAATRKGVLSFDVRPLDQNVLRQELLAAKEYFIKTDVLRGQIDAVLNNLDMLERLPGAGNFRSQDGVTVAEMRLNLEGLVRYRLEPLTVGIWSNRLFVDTDTLGRYVQNRLFQNELALDAALALGRTIQDSMRDYVADSAGGLSTARLEANGSGGASTGSSAQSQRTLQIGDGFLERVIALAGASGDGEFRQALTTRIIEAGERTVALQRESTVYEQVSSRLRQATGSAPDPELLRATGIELDRLSADANELFGQTNRLYDELSSQNLNPQAMLYEVTSPFAVTFLRAVNLQTVNLYALITLLAALLAVPLSCLLHSYFRRLIQPN